MCISRIATPERTDPAEGSAVRNCVNAIFNATRGIFQLIKNRLWDQMKGSVVQVGQRSVGSSRQTMPGCLSTKVCPIDGLSSGLQKRHGAGDPDAILILASPCRLSNDLQQQVGRVGRKRAYAVEQKRYATLP